MARRGGLRARIRELAACKDCRASGGLWRPAPTGQERCGCDRGKLLRVMDLARERRAERMVEA